MFLAGSAVPALLIAVAAVFLAVIAIYVRARTIEENFTSVPQWPRAFGYDDSVPCDWSARVELIERLAIVAEPWAIDELHIATKEERDPRVRKAIDAAWKDLR